METKKTNNEEVLKQKIKTLRAEVQALENSIKKKTKVIHLRESQNQFLTKRIKELYGQKGLNDILNHIDCPMGFKGKHENNI